jgi:hypothetical protein
VTSDPTQTGRSDMGSNNEMTRKEFITLTFTLIGATAVGACSDDNNNNTGTGGISGTGRGGTTGSAGKGGSGGAAGTTGTGGTGTASCADPLPEMQAAADHTHTLTVPASTLSATTAQTFNTSSVLGHMHMITLEPAQLTAIKGGGSATVTSTSAGSPAHTHVFTVSCH